MKELIFQTYFHGPKLFFKHFCVDKIRKKLAKFDLLQKIEILTDRTKIFLSGT